MFYKILLSVFLAAFIAACSTTPKDTGDSSGSGSSGTSVTSSTVPSSGDAAILEDLINTPLGGPSVESGSGKDIEMTLEETFVVEVGDRVYFDYDSAELDADAQELLQYQAAWFKENNITSITIEGHCDERGTREYNLALGEKRAQAVKNYLNGLAVFPVINTLSYGKERPAVIGSNEGAWGQNRRSVTKLN